MKIGILTLSLHTNYGGILQAYALETVLKHMGHDVCLIEKYIRPAYMPIWKAPFSYGKRILENLIGHPNPIFYEQKLNREKTIVRQNIEDFINSHIVHRVIKDFHEVQKYDFDAIVVGSDQIWRPKFFNDKIENAYLEFAETWNIKRVAYAASFGTDEWEYSSKQTEKCGSLLRLFDAVSVREDSGINLCRKYLGVDAVQMLDPTMLLNTKDYIKLFETANAPKSDGTLLCAILDRTSKKNEFINRIAKEKNLVPFNVGSKSDDINAPIQDRILYPIERWLRGFYDAKFVITDSFHACVFSILFNKPFIACGNASRGMSRFISLLGMFGLQDRLLMDLSEYKDLGGINWQNINSILNEKRKEAFHFLSSLN